MTVSDTGRPSCVKCNFLGHWVSSNEPSLSFLCDNVFNSMISQKIPLLSSWYLAGKDASLDVSL